MGSTSQTFPLLVGALLLSLLACEKKTTAPTPLQNYKNANAPSDLTMERLHLQSYNGEALEWELRAPLADGYTFKSFVVAKELDMTLYEQGRPSSNVTADEGFLFTRNNNSTQLPQRIPKIDGKTFKPGDMYLKGNVVLISTDGAKLETEWVRYDRSIDILSSTAPVRIVRTDSITTGIGLEATADLSRVRIFKQTVIIKDPEDNEERDDES